MPMLHSADSSLCLSLGVAEAPGKGPKGVLQDQTAAAHVPSTSPTHSGSRSKGLHYRFCFLVILQVQGLDHSSSCRRHSVCHRT